MAEKARTAQKGKAGGVMKRACRTCGADSRVVQFTGFGKKGFYWVCEKNAEHAVKTR